MERGIPGLMRILLLTQFFDPEPMFKGLPFAHELQRRGHEVEVLTGFPNYPGGNLYPGYRVRPWRREILDGVPVLRVPLYPSHDRSSWRRTLNYATFALSASMLGPLLVKRPDVVYSYHPPATVALPALVIKMLVRSPVVYDIQDLWPDTVRASGMVSGRRILGMLGLWCNFAYRRMDQITVLSPGFRTTLLSRGLDPEKVHVIYNWCDEARISDAGGEPALARELGFAGHFNVVFAGTMGLAQGLETVLEAARICRERCPAARFVFVGGGVEKARLEVLARVMALDNVVFLDRQAPERIGRILALADVLLVHLKDDPLFRITIPSKSQAYMVAGRPILIAVRGDAAELVERAGAGLSCEPENALALADTVIRMYAMACGERDAMGAAGKSFYERELSLRAGVDRFEEVFHAAVQAGAGRVGIRVGVTR
jgi:colanic acid biosynthesis glycosyl transferase WcaI